MAPITPLGKALTQQPLVGAEIPLSGSVAPVAEKPISASQWLSLARASWTWILRPLWYLCFKWPAQMLLLMRPPQDEGYWQEKKRQEDEAIRQRQNNESARRMAGKS